MTKLFRNPLFYAILVLIAANIAVFWKFYFKGLLPFPGNLLVSYYFPWNSGGFPGFDSWTTRKDVIAMDVIRQMYPWKTLTFDLIKSGQLPLWNPFNFSGTPLLANLQSSVFFPGNLLFLLLPYLSAWIGLVVGLPFVFSLFSYIFLRSLKLSRPSAIFGAIVVTNVSYITVWAEQLVVIQSALFLPLILWAINKYAEKKKFIFLLFVPIFLAFSIFGGHIQTVAYVYIVSFAFMIFRRIPIRFSLVVLLLSACLAAIQLIPSVELYLQSAREGPASKELFYQSTLPWRNLATIISPDIFGNPATNNFQGRDYGNFQAYFGTAAFILSILAMLRYFRNPVVKFFLGIGVAGLIFSLAPFAYIFEILKLPILSSGYPSRIIFVFQFSMSVLAAFGFESLLDRTAKISKKTVFSFILILLSGCVLFFLSGNKRNLILPGGIIGLTGLLIFLSKTKLRSFVLLFIGVAILEYAYFFNKYQPFAPQKFVFPNHPVFQFLQTTAGIDRFFGYDRAYVDSNFSTYYRTFSPEGYDPLYIRRYGEFLASSEDGKLPETVARSDAFAGKTDNSNRQRLFDLIGIKYALDKTDEPAKDWGPNPEKFPANRFEFIKQYNKWKFYERKTVLSRVFLAGNYQIVTDSDQTIKEFYRADFNPRQTLLLELPPAISPENGGAESAEISSYSPNSLLINTKSDRPKLLFLSDSYYPGWKAYMDANETPILRADYTFRAVSVPAGNHTVRFEYRPLSFISGAIISLSTGILLIFSFIYFGRRTRHHD